MTGGQNYVNFWTLRPNLSSRLGRKNSKDTEEKTEPQSPSAESNSPPAAVFKGDPMSETFLCGVAIGNTGGCPSAVVTGTASGSFAVWQEFECVRMLPGAHGTLLSHVTNVCR